MKAKKLLILTMISVMVFSVLLSSCAPKEEVAPGSIDIAEKQKEEKAKKNKHNIFIKTEDKFGYSYDLNTIPRAQMNIEIPDRWELKTVSNRYYQIIPDSSYDRFKDTGICVLFDYDPGTWTRKSTIDTQYKNFSWELPALSYRTSSGGSYGITANYGLMNMKENAPWCTEDGRVLYGENTDSLIKNTKTFDKTDELKTIYYFVRWTDDVFACFSAITPGKNIEQTRSVMERIISSITYVPLKINSLSRTEVGGFTFDAPSDMVIPKDNKNLLFSSVRSKNATSGMSVLVEKEKKKIGVNDLLKKPGEMLVRKLLNPSQDYSITVNVSDTSHKYIDGREAEYSESIVTMDIFESGIKAERIPAYPVPSTYYMETYSFDDGYMIATICQNSQKKMSDVIISSLENGSFS